MMPSSKEAAIGAILGAFVGDAAGVTLEFRAIKSDQQVRDAMRMPGGGVFRVGPGQISDDSELALCLLKGLLTSSPPQLPLDAIAALFGDWYTSPPFDMGHTIASALAWAGGEVESPAAECTKQAAHHNQNSKSNGALMRQTPLAVWGHAAGPAQLADWAMQETRLTHPNIACQHASAAYCIAIARLVQRPGDAAAAAAAALGWLQQKQGCEEVVGWLQQALGEQDPVAGEEQAFKQTIGFARWGFQLAFWHLNQGSSYEDAIFDTLRRGGDTDTNAAIVGGLLGALHGAGAVPSYMAGPVLERDAGSEGRPRPAFLQTAGLLELAEQLYNMAAGAAGAAAAS